MKYHHVKDLMSRKVLCAKVDWPLERLAEFLIENSISGAPVIGVDGRLMGVVSMADVIRHDSVPAEAHHNRQTHAYYRHALEQQMDREEIAGFRFGAADSTTVENIMTPLIFDIDENSTIKEAANVMLLGHIHRLFVTSEGRIIGVISALDLLKAVRDH